MRELEAGIRDLHERVSLLGDLLSEDQIQRDLHERLAESTVKTAEEAGRLAKLAHDMVRRTFLIVTVALVTWTPFLTYGAVWVHELVRNTCYNGVTLVESDEDAWYCSIFPGTGRHRGD